MDRYESLLWPPLGTNPNPPTAKSLVAAGLARRALVQLSYAIGVAEPLSIYVDTYGTGKKTDEELVAIIKKNWDLRPGVIGMLYPLICSSSPLRSL